MAAVETLGTSNVIKKQKQYRGFPFPSLKKENGRK
jgi:hypothetical protein